MRFLLALLLAGCAVETIVAAREADAGMVAPDAGMSSEVPCEGPNDCQSDEFCEKASCGARSGFCAVRPVACDASVAPVCGCDGITYFNDCLRRASGVLRARADQCGRDGMRCGGPPHEACEEGAACAQIAPPGVDFCDSEAPGMCWVLPAVCGAPAGGDRYRSCRSDAPPCLDLCTAIRQQAPILREQGCQDGF